MADTIWQLDHVVLPGDRANRLDNVSLTITTGVTAVVGYSGAGKTSLLNLLAGLEKPARGRIASQLSASDDEEPNSLKLYWVPQDGGLWPHMTVRAHVEAVLPESTAARTRRPSNGPTAKNTAEVFEFTDKLLTEFDLLHRQHAFPGDLSMGECSRLSVTRALATQPSVLLMDEPLAHVDPVRRLRYWDVIRGYLNDSQASLLFTTHEHETAVRESEWVACLAKGQVVWSGATSELYRNPPNVEAGQFLGPVNWFTPEDAARWLEHGDSEHPVALRPESIHLQSDKNGAAEVLSFQFCGSYAETVLQHKACTEQRTITHRPAGHVHHVGQCVRIETAP